MQALFRHAGTKVSADTRANALHALMSWLDSEDENVCIAAAGFAQRAPFVLIDVGLWLQVRALAAGGVGASFASAAPGEVDAMVADLLSVGASTSWVATHGKLLALTAGLRYTAAPGYFSAQQTCFAQHHVDASSCRYSAAALGSQQNLIVEAVRRLSESDKVPVRQTLCAMIGFLISRVRSANCALRCNSDASCVHVQAEAAGGRQDDLLHELVPTLSLFMKDSASDVRRSAIGATKRFAKLCPAATVRLMQQVRVVAFGARQPCERRFTSMFAARRWCRRLLSR